MFKKCVRLHSTTFEAFFFFISIVKTKNIFLLNTTLEAENNSVIGCFQSIDDTIQYIFAFKSANLNNDSLNYYFNRRH